MIDYSNCESKLDEYAEAFDIYIECGEMPPTMPHDDCLAGYMREVIDSNPQIDGSDPTWVEVLKEGLMDYFSQLIKAFADIQRNTESELALISRFENAEIDEKREMWAEVYQKITGKYSKFEVDIEGYSRQFAERDTDAVFDALIGDWRSACADANDKQQRNVLRKSQKRWERVMQQVGNRDYEIRRRIDEATYTTPVLKEIIDVMGRERESSDEMDNIVYTFIPKGVKAGLPSEDVDRIECGDNLHRTLAAEFAMPDDIFFRKFATKELQQLAPPRQRKPQKIEQHRPKPRPRKGPVIIGVDTSASMSGRPEKIAKAIVMQLVRMARKQKRSCFLITFSIRIKWIDLGRAANLFKLKDFLDCRFSGGTDERELIKKSLQLIEKGEYEMADVLIISDFVFNSPTWQERARINEAKRKGTRFYGLQIGSSSKVFDELLDKKWKA